jgi:sulfite exporter TauE/SafE
MAAYQSARLSAYAVVGSLAGGIGTVTEKAFTRPVTQALPWVLVTLLLIFGLRMDRWLPKPIWLSRWHGRMMSWSRNTPAPLLGAMLGLATPFLPCGPLYVLFLVCLFTGSAVQGATLALAFGLGTLPLLWAVQTGLARWQIRLSPGLVRWAQSGVALLAAGIVAWRALVVSPDWLEALCH